MSTQQREHDKYILRFDAPGHRERLKQQAATAKRSLNRHILLLLEVGERAIGQHGDGTMKEVVQ